MNDLYTNQYIPSNGYGDDALPSPAAGMRGFFLAILTLSASLLSYWGDSPKMAMLSQAVVIFLSVMIFTSILFTSSKVMLTKEFFLIICFFMWCILTLPFSYNVRLSVFEIKTLVKMLLMAFVVLNAVSGRKAYQWFLMALIIGTLIAAFGGITGLARGSEVIETAAGSQSRYVGAFGNPNGMGKLANTGFWAAICMFFLCRQKKMRIILIGISVLCVVVVGWTGSRQAIISLVLTLGGIYWFVVRRQAQNTGSKGVWLLVFAVLFVALIGFLSKTDFWHRMERLGGMLTGQEGDLEEYGRFIYIRRSFGVALENPIIGVGYGCVKLFMEPGTIKSPHNTIFGMAANVGLVGWGLFFGAWLSVLLRMRQLGKMNLPAVDQKLILMSWCLHLVVFFWTFTAELQHLKLFWILFMANAAYVNWVSNTYDTRYMTEYDDDQYSENPY